MSSLLILKPHVYIAIFQKVRSDLHCIVFCAHYNRIVQEELPGKIPPFWVLVRGLWCWSGPSWSKLIFTMSGVFFCKIFIKILRCWLIAWQLDLQMENRNCAHFRELELRRKKAEVEILSPIIIAFNLHNLYTTMQWKIKKREQ